MSEAEGDKQWKAAQKLTSPSLLSFRMKSDWELAGPLYEKAATNFRVSASLHFFLDDWHYVREGRSLHVSRTPERRTNHSSYGFL